MKVLFSYPPSPPLFSYFPQLTLSSGYDSIGGGGKSNTLMGPVEARQERAIIIFQGVIGGAFFICS